MSARIILVRHGPVALKAAGLFSFEDFTKYCEAYEAQGLAPHSIPPARTVALVTNAARVFASPAARAVDSIRALGIAERARIDAVFAEEPNAAPRFGGRWPLLVWFAASRGAGALLPARAENRRLALARARSAADMLSDVRDGESAALVGHGWFNRIVAMALCGGRPERAVVWSGRPPMGLCDLRPGPLGKPRALIRTCAQTGARGKLSRAR